MRVVYTVEQKSGPAYRKLKSHAATIGQLGYPSRLGSHAHTRAPLFVQCHLNPSAQTRTPSLSTAQ